MASFGSDLLEQASEYILTHTRDDEATRLNIQISNDLLTLVDSIVDKTGRSRSIVIEQLLYHSVTHFPCTSERLL